MTIRERRTGWLNAAFYYRFRELLAHAQFRFAIACPIFCMLPDHIHLLWMGIRESSDQLLAIRHLRKRLNLALSDFGFTLQDQAFDNVLTDEESNEAGLRTICEYIARNPERLGLVGVDEYANYPYSGCLVPNYPELTPFAPDFWRRLDRAVSYLRRNGLTRV